MSMWDVIIIAVVCLAIFRGYFKGLCRRLSDWVGLVIAFVASTLSVSHIDGFVSGTLGVDGRSKIGEWLESYFASRVSANPDNQLESLKQWVRQSLFAGYPQGKISTAPLMIRPARSTSAFIIRWRGCSLIRSGTLCC